MVASYSVRAVLDASRILGGLAGESIVVELEPYDRREQIIFNSGNSAAVMFSDVPRGSSGRLVARILGMERELGSANIPRMYKDKMVVLKLGYPKEVKGNGHGHDSDSSH